MRRTQPHRQTAVNKAAAKAKAAARVGRHLASRFVGSLKPGGPSASDERWVASVLSEAEMQLWRRMSGPDRRHGVTVAKQVSKTLPPELVTPAVQAAALLHDVGKICSGFGTAGRVWATLCTLALGHARLTGWRNRSGWRGRVGRYAAHPEMGAELLQAAGSDPLIVAWAAQHHEPPGECVLAPEVAEAPQVTQALRAADNDAPIRR